MALIDTGYMEYEELAAAQALPDGERFAKGPVAIIECMQEIPCNPCEAACRFGAIKIGEPITNLPVLAVNKCTGCGVCVSACPGLAIFVVNKSYSETGATVAFPYEYFPVPEKDDIVRAVNRKGDFVCMGRVIKVQNPKSFDHTPVVTLEVPKSAVDQVRGIQRRQNP